MMMKLTATPNIPPPYPNTLVMVVRTIDTSRWIAH